MLQLWITVAGSGPDSSHLSLVLFLDERSVGKRLAPCAVVLKNTPFPFFSICLLLLLFIISLQELSALPSWFLPIVSLIISFFILSRSLTFFFLLLAPPLRHSYSLCYIGKELLHQKVPSSLQSPLLFFSSPLSAPTDLAFGRACSTFLPSVLFRQLLPVGLSSASVQTKICQQ